MAIPGVLMRLSDNVSPIEIPNIEGKYTLKADDNKTPGHNTVYFLSDISPLLSSKEHYDDDATTNLSTSWVICAFINGRDTEGAGELQTSPHVPPTPPARGSVLVINGSTPHSDKEADYHAWYDQEHGAKLTRVPGWQAARRYSLAKVYGAAETANFYGFNFYDEKNGLGGPEWQAGVTGWTLRIRSNAAKPNIRRVWKVEGTQ
ncbi:hypothetical protein N7510_009749 [Penicillium lagena]|uniref:uncharacterized protein n=1 Tax=Penicillium lagena TaxID=94218 RepID=UPI002540AA81|nr:uncharacterized protein N7510_009749 [Penicillium lagena]KAJ5604595.1 hypothetical protein N7510_009749 [Penicillium lagena]